MLRKIAKAMYLSRCMKVSVPHAENSCMQRFRRRGEAPGEKTLDLND